jgi:hypothetical protein
MIVSFEQNLISCQPNSVVKQMHSVSSVTSVLNKTKTHPSMIWERRKMSKAKPIRRTKKRKKRSKESF